MEATMIDLGAFTYNGEKLFDITKIPTGAADNKSQKSTLVKETATILTQVAELQSRLISDSKEAVLICLQALDAAGKDSLVKHTLCALNPLGVSIYTYRTPSIVEASHDFLWRYHPNLPSRGRIAVFNRSYYEEVLVVKVHEDYKTYNMPKRMLVDDDGNFDYIAKKYSDIRNWETYLYNNGIRVVKIFLNVSRDTQRERFLERLDRPDKNYKFSSNDIAERAYFDKYQTAFCDAINNTATANCPWYVIPADDKWFTRYIFTKILHKTLTDIDPQYRTPSNEEIAKFQSCREQLQ